MESNASSSFDIDENSRRSSIKASEITDDSDDEQFLCGYGR